MKTEKYVIKYFVRQLDFQKYTDKYFLFSRKPKMKLVVKIVQP